MYLKRVSSRKAALIRGMYFTGLYSYRDLAEKFGIHWSIVKYIVNSP